MLRFLTSLIVVLAGLAMSLDANAAAYRDPAGRFTVGVPEGWQYVKPDNADVITIVMAASKTGGSGYDAACIGLYLDIAETRSKSQAEINSLVEGELTPEFWRQTLKSTGDKDFKINSTGSREVGGRKIHNVVFTGTSEENGKSQTARGKMELHFVPGSLHSFMCVTEVESFETASTQFDRIFESYEPGRAALIASATSGPASVLTMYSKQSYSGVARVLAQDTPNLAAAGWVASAGSLAVDGIGSWQVCESANYSGTCNTVSSAMSPSDHQLIIVNSARRLSDQPGLQSAASTALKRSVNAYRARERQVR
ncbi:MAG: beta/gamma crystallin-related protein [Micropepsaceae bacterium]